MFYADQSSDRRAANRRLPMWGLIALLLLSPLVAMQFTNEVAWDGADFAAAALLLVGGGLAYEVAARLATGAGTRAALGLAILAVVVLLWVQGAVGLL